MNKKEKLAIEEATDKANKQELNIDDAIKLTKEYPHSHRAHCLLSNVYLQNGENEKCLQQVKKSFKYGSSSPAFNISALCNINLELYDEAREDYIKALKINPIDPNTIRSYSNLLNKIGDHEERHKIIKKLDLISPNDLAVRVAIIRSFFTISDFKGAIDYIQSIISDFENEHQIHYLLGASLCSLDKFEDAKESFKMALEKSNNPEDLKKNIEDNFIALD